MDTNVSSGSNKNTLILAAIAALIFLSVLYIYAVTQNTATPVKVPSLTKKTDMLKALDINFAELNSLDVDLSLFAEDDNISQELDLTLNEVGEIKDASTSLINDEKNLSSLEGDLGSLVNDEAANKEIDKALQDVSL